jgi:hypothetical protein
MDQLIVGRSRLEIQRPNVLRRQDRVLTARMLMAFQCSPIVWAARLLPLRARRRRGGFV